MTALAQYRRLEAMGQWRESEDSPPREVIVSFGQATLVFSDPGSETPLTHWSLPAIINLTPGRPTAIYAPAATAGGAPTGETLTISEPEMIEAITRVHRAIETALPHPGRLRRRVLLAGVALAIAAAAWWLPGQIIRHSTAIAPPAQRHLVGKALLAEIEQITGPACNRVAGAAVLTRLAERLGPAAAVTPGPEPAGTGSGRDVSLHVLPGGMTGAMALPGGIILIGPDLLGLAAHVPAAPMVESGPEPDHSHLTSDRPVPRPADRAPAAALPDSGPEILAGAILSAMQLAAEQDPMAATLEHAGVQFSLRLLIRGRPDNAALHDQASRLLTRPPPLPEDRAALLTRFAAVSLPTGPHAGHLGLDEPLALALLEGDPMRDRSRPRPILSDGEWQALREICNPD